MPGIKYDAGKPRLDLLPPKAILAIGEVMTYGAAKYGANNWLFTGGLQDDLRREDQR